MTGPVAASTRGRKLVAPPSEEFAGLGLDILRTYRKALRSEESRVSYWRRLVQTRLDLLLAYNTSGRGDGPGLRALLSSERIGALRTALLDVHPADGMPPLPDLLEMWERVVPAGDIAAHAELISDLRDAEHTLSEYRHALHGRLDDATRELVSRYRANPQLCFEVLPLREHIGG
ncbi:MAG: hypothetical protein QOC93_770 [Actinomycetota bacterium]|nr:hypothetical protein [Cryptosporangiaceae bacterium]MDQ1675626.1 hypothetical protein [Actinomycetota bacterium]